MTAYERKRELYREYCLECQKVDGNQYSQEIADQQFAIYLDSPNYRWIKLTGDDIDPEDIFAGFAVVHKSKDDPQTEEDYSLLNAYVDRRYRGQGRMQEAFGGYLDRHPGKWLVVVHKKYVGNDAYWIRFFREHGYTQYTPEDDGSLPKGCVALGFKKEEDETADIDWKV